jgi:hypothetical protein
MKTTDPKNKNAKTNKHDERKWTVMVYLAGDNNLSEEMVYALKEMFRIGNNPEIRKIARVVVQFDPKGARPRRYDFSDEKSVSSEADGVIDQFQTVISAQSILKILKSESRFTKAIAKSRNPAELKKAIEGVIGNSAESLPLQETITRLRKPITNRAESDLFQDLIESLIEDAANPLTIKEFISSTVNDKKHSSEYNMIVLSGHGSGAVGDFLPDENPQNALSIPELKRVLSDVLGKNRKVDILGMDSCLMSTAEVCYELRDVVKFLVGAEGFERNNGWPYHRILEAFKELKSAKELNPENLAKTIVEKYIGYYTDYEVAGVSTDHSACDLKDFKPRVRPVIATLARMLEAGLDYPPIQDSIVLAHWKAQSYKAEQYVDLYDFCKLLEKSLDSMQKLTAAIPANSAIKNKEATQQENATKALEILRNIITACREVKKVIEDDQEPVVLMSCYSGAAFQHSHGLSVYFPWSESQALRDSRDLLEYENNLDFAKDTGWPKFIRKYLDVTRRERRDQERNEGQEPLRFGRADDTVLFVRTGTQNAIRTGTQNAIRTDSQTGTMKNPPDGFFRTESYKKISKKADLDKRNMST